MSSLLNGPVTLCVVILGSFANILTIYVLSRKTLQRHSNSLHHSLIQQPKKLSNSVTQNDRRSGDSTTMRRRQTRSHSGITVSNRPRVYTFFVWLAIADTFLLFSALLMYSVPNLLQGRLGIYVKFFPFFYLMSNTALTASVWLMCTLMADRYRTLCSPFSIRSTNINLVHRILLSVCVVALIFSLPRFFELYVETDPTTGVEYVSQTNLVNSQLYMIGYRIFGGLMLYSLLPYAILFILSFRVWLVIRSAAMARMKMNASTTSTTPHSMILYSCATDSEMILIAVTSKFLLSRLIPTILDVVEHIVGPQQFTGSSSLTLCVDISNLIVVTSSGINFLIFYSFSASFRKSLSLVMLLNSSKDDRPIISPPVNNLSTVTMTINVGDKNRNIQKLPRQLSLQTDRRREPGKLSRKSTLGGIPLSNAKRSIRCSPLETNQQQAATLLRVPSVECADSQRLPSEETAAKDVTSLP